MSDNWDFKGVHTFVPSAGWRSWTARISIHTIGLTKMTYHGVFFDLYGTLLIYGDLSTAWSDWLSAIHQSLRECGFSVSKALLASRCDSFFARPAPLAQEDGLSVLERRIQALCADLGVNVGPKAIL